MSISTPQANLLIGMVNGSKKLSYDHSVDIFFFLPPSVHVLGGNFHPGRPTGLVEDHSEKSRTHGEVLRDTLYSPQDIFAGFRASACK